MFIEKEALRQHYGLSSQEPTREQMKAIFKEFEQLLESKEEPTEVAFDAIVKNHCTTFQQFQHKKE
ncbi:hypothetical protein ACN469_05100 [Corallococcus terminator]